MHLLYIRVSPIFRFEAKIAKRKRKILKRNSETDRLFRFVLLRSETAILYAKRKNLKRNENFWMRNKTNRKRNDAKRINYKAKLCEIKQVQ